MTRSLTVLPFLALSLFAASLAAGCGGSDTGSTEGGIGDGEIKGEGGGDGSGRGGSSGGFAESGASADGSGSAPAPSGSSSSGSSATPPPATPPKQVQPGTLTAGVWDDNRNFDLFLSYRAGVVGGGGPRFLGLTDAEHAAAHSLGAAIGPKQTLDVSLVIDTTGSMGDEIRYLTKEFSALASTIQGKYPGAQQRWSLVLYKDTTDEYIVRWFDFRADTVEFQAKLSAQSAGGGGDFPEAPDQALSIANRLAWRSGPSTARLMFWVADAPYHDDKSTQMTAAIRGSRDKGIHIYPVASSGIDEFTELGMRSAAQVTNGRYVFLTNDSGVGGAHKEPSTPCYFVTKLDQAILRMVDIEMTGTYREPTPEEILRTGGDPSNGACNVSGKNVVIY